MESDSIGDGRADARAALDAIAADRRRLARRVASPMWWYYLVSALLGAVIVASPATGSVFGVTMIAALATIALSSIEITHRRRTGLTIIRPAGPWSLLAVVVLGVVVLALFAASVAMAVLGLSGWIVATAVSAVIAVLLGHWLTDRVTRRELERAR